MKFQKNFDETNNSILTRKPQFLHPPGCGWHFKKGANDQLIHFLIADLATMAFFNSPDEAEVAGLMTFLIFNTFQAVPTQCPAAASASPVASPAFSPNLVLFVAFVILIAYSKKLNVYDGNSFFLLSPVGYHSGGCG